MSDVPERFFLLSLVMPFLCTDAVNDMPRPHHFMLAISHTSSDAYCIRLLQALHGVLLPLHLLLTTQFVLKQLVFCDEPTVF